VQPQSGTIVNGLGITALQGLFSEILKLDNPDFKSLIDTRILLEQESARLAAINRTNEDLLEIKEAFVNHKQKLLNNQNAVEEDLMFHLKIGKASKNTVLKSLMTIITPDIVSNYNKYRVCDDDNFNKTIEEHRRIIQKIEDKDPQGAVEAMKAHLNDIRKISLQKKN
jgi:GntR family transcriptional repressor for pyruvate dehydrogenase complex